jgi:hypothetical protein
MLDIVDMEGKREPSKTSELKVGWGIQVYIGWGGVYRYTQ